MKQQCNLPDGRSVTVIGELEQTDYQGRLCYAVRTRGDHAAYFDADGTILATFDLSNGVRETLYVPGGEFTTFAEAMHEHGGWGR